MSETASIDALSTWVAGRERVQESGNDIKLLALSGDAGHRQYFRIARHPELLAVYAPPQWIDSQIFVDLVQYLREQGIHAPRVYDFDREQGFLLIENLGDELYLSALTADNVEALYGESLLTLLRLQQSPRDPQLLSAYDGEKLQAEMDLFPKWFAQQLLGHSLNTEEKKLLARVFKQLLDSALEQPAVFVHRDYHSRNLIHREGAPPGVIDFQDAVWGPVTYDLVSLLKDCYVRWPRETVNRWAQAYATMATSAGLIKPVAPEQFQRWFDWMGLQRHIKVLGIFARLYLRDNKRGYLQDLPLVMRYTLEATSDYPEFSEFNAWFGETLLPLCQQQDWYQDYRSAGYTPKGEAMAP